MESIQYTFNTFGWSISTAEAQQWIQYNHYQRRWTISTENNASPRRLPLTMPDNWRWVSSAHSERQNEHIFLGQVRLAQSTRGLEVWSQQQLWSVNAQHPPLRCANTDIRIGLKRWVGVPGTMARTGDTNKELLLIAGFIRNSMQWPPSLLCIELIVSEVFRNWEPEMLHIVARCGRHIAVPWRVCGGTRLFESGLGQ